MNGGRNHEFGKPFKGVGRNTDRTQRLEGSDTTNSVQRMYVPIGKKIAYACFCCDVQLQKDDINWTRLTVGRDRPKFGQKISTKLAGLETIKVKLNSIVSTRMKYTQQLT